jgi:hypothetical protein
MNESSRLLATNIAPLPSINMQLETVIKIPEVRTHFS